MTILEIQESTRLEIGAKSWIPFDRREIDGFIVSNENIGFFHTGGSMNSRVLFFVNETNKRKGLSRGFSFFSLFFFLFFFPLSFIHFFRDAIFVTFTNLATSVFAGLVIFSIMGFLARQMGVSVEDVIQSGAGLAFIAYPEAVVRMPLPNVWAVLFFVMLFILGIGSQVSEND